MFLILLESQLLTSGNDNSEGENYFHFLNLGICMGNYVCLPFRLSWSRFCCDMESKGKHPRSNQPKLGSKKKISPGKVKMAVVILATLPNEI